MGATKGHPRCVNTEGAADYPSEAGADVAECSNEAQTCLDCGVSVHRHPKTNRFPRYCAGCSAARVKISKDLHYQKTRAALPQRVCDDCGCSVAPKCRFCKDCTRERRRRKAAEWRKANPDLARERTRQSMARLRLRDRDGVNHRKRLLRYGVDTAFLERLLAAQENACHLCGVPEEELPKGLFIDHDHNCCSGASRKACGKCVRGLLCANCNTALGMLEDDPARLRKAAAYIEQHRVRGVQSA